VGLWSAAETVAFNHAGEASSLGQANYVYPITGVKLSYGQYLTNLIFTGATSTEFTQMANRWYTSSCLALWMLCICLEQAKMASLAPCQALLLDIPKA